MKKKSKPKKSKYILEKEIEFLNESKSTDKFDYQISIRTTLALLAFMTSLVVLLGHYSETLSFIAIVWLWLFLFIAIIMSNYFKRFKPIREVFAKKHNLVRKNYEKLGVDLKVIDKELGKNN